MVSTPDYHKNLRFEHQPVAILADEHSEYFFMLKCLSLAVMVSRIS